MCAVVAHGSIAIVNLLMLLMLILMLLPLHQGGYDRGCRIHVGTCVAVVADPGCVQEAAEGACVSVAGFGVLTGDLNVAVTGGNVIAAVAVVAGMCRAHSVVRLCGGGRI